MIARLQAKVTVKSKGCQSKDIVLTCLMVDELC
jgi:hypothetical protein